jgi:hypothetical protein
MTEIHGKANLCDWRRRKRRVDDPSGRCWRWHRRQRRSLACFAFFVFRTPGILRICSNVGRQASLASDFSVTQVCFSSDFVSTRLSSLTKKHIRKVFVYKSIDIVAWKKCIQTFGSSWSIHISSWSRDIVRSSNMHVVLCQVITLATGTNRLYSVLCLLLQRFRFST